MDDLTPHSPPENLEPPAVRPGAVARLREHARSRPPLILARDAAAFTLSALLSPYLVIPFGTLFVIASRFASRRDALWWTAASIFFSTFVPAAYVVIQWRRGKITDVHVMEREQRGGPFFVAIVSAALGTITLRAVGAPLPVWSIGLVLTINGIVMVLITGFFKISIHVAVLSATVLAAILLVPDLEWWKLGWMVPALIWARVTRGRHTLLQGISACVVACGLTFALMRAVLILTPQPDTGGAIPARLSPTKR